MTFAKMTWATLCVRLSLCPCSHRIPAECSAHHRSIQGPTHTIALSKGQWRTQRLWNRSRHLYWPGCCSPEACFGYVPVTILYEKIFNLNLSGNEGYYMIFQILVVQIMLCSRLHRQKVLFGKSFRIRSDHVLQVLNQLDVFFRVVRALLATNLLIYFF